MKNQGRYRHLRVDWVGESSTQSITLCGVEGEDIGTGQTLCPDCVKVGDALNVCGLGPESLRELFDTLRVIGPSEVKAKMEALRGLASSHPETHYLSFLKGCFYTRYNGSWGTVSADSSDRAAECSRCSFRQTPHPQNPPPLWRPATRSQP